MDLKTLLICRAYGCDFPSTSNNGRREHEINMHPDIERELYGKRGETLHFDSTEERDAEKHRIIAKMSIDALDVKKALKEESDVKINEVLNVAKSSPSEFLGIEPVILDKPEPVVEVEPEPEPEPVKIVEPKPEPEVVKFVVERSEPIIPEPEKKQSSFLDVIKSIENNLTEDLK